MSEQIVIGSIIEGKVIKVTPFGAIVSLNNGSQGLVHISQIANSFVKDINDHVKVGDEVKVKVLSIEEDTKRISLSIRAAMPKVEKPEGVRSQKPSYNKNHESKPSYNTSYSDRQSTESSTGNDFEDIMKDFLKQSSDKQASLNKRANKRN